MSDIFIKIFNLGVTAGWLVLAILVCRPLMKRAPKWINCLLWGIVGLRLCLPFELESVFSLIPSAETLPTDVMMSPTPEINSGVGVINNAINPIFSSSLEPGIGTSVNPLQLLIAIASFVWLVGVALMLGYGIVSYISLRIKVRASVRGEGKTYLCDEVDSPFILGVICPRIYVPSGMSGDALEHVLAHENAHLRRGDHLWKPIGFAILAFYWFNPLLWIAYALLCRDIEGACDEKVIKRMPDEAKKSYSEALLACSLHRRRIMACPLAFGEVGVKQRIKSVLNYKKPAFWVIIAALVVTVVLSICFLTNPQGNVHELLEPGSKWLCDDDMSINVTVDSMATMEGIFSVGDQFYEIIIRYRNDGRKIRAYVLKAKIEDIKYESDSDLVSNVEYNEWRDRVEAEHLLFSGILTARGDDVVLKVDEDNVGLGRRRLVFERTVYSLANYPQTYGYENDKYIKITDSGCDTEGVDVSFIWSTREESEIVFWLKWKNKTFTERSIGESFKIYRYGESNELVPLEGFGYWKEYALKVSRSVTYMSYEITEHFDISTPGKYRFESFGAWIEFEVFVNTNLGLDASNGLDVLVWQMAKGSYSFALRPHTDEASEVYSSMLMGSRGVNAAEMREILSTYNVSEDEIYIVPWQNPVSSYVSDYVGRWVAISDVTPYREMYLAIVRDMILGDTPKSGYPCIYESAHFDVDGDGKEETNRVCLGLVDGRFMFSYIVSEDGKTAEYFDTFYTEPMSLKFFEDESGKYFLRGKTDEGDVIIYDIEIKNGHVKLTENRYEQVTENELDLSKLELSLVDRIVVTGGMTGEQVYLRPYYNEESYFATLDAVKEIKAADPVSNRGYYGYTYYVELYYDYQTVFSFSVCPDADGAYIICGYYETVGGCDYPARYKLTSPSYEKLDEVLGKCFK